MQGSSEWIDKQLFKARNDYREVYQNVTSLISDAAWAVKREGGDEAHAMAFVYGLHFSTMPMMWELMKQIIHDVYSEREDN
jgi:hypothetical protein